MNTETVTNGNGATKKQEPKIPTVVGLLAVEVECEGLTPLLINRMPMETLEAMRTKTKAPKSAATGRGTPREECENKVYLLPDGSPCLPIEMLFSSLVAAGTFVRLDGKRQISSAKSTVLPALMSVMDVNLKLYVPGSPKQAAAWEPDMRQGRNPNGGEAVCIVRPRFDAWAFKARITIDTREIGEQVIRNLWDMAGRRCGIGDFRPNRKGIFGQYIVKCWERI